MKIKTWKAWHDPKACPAIAHDIKHHRLFPSPCRVVPEATWRKVMAVVKAAELEDWECVAALRAHERKRK